MISVTERQSYILRVRNLARQCGEAFLLTDAGGFNLKNEAPPSDRSEARTDNDKNAEAGGVR